MQPANLHLDPMANLWPTNDASKNNYFSSNPTTSPEQNAGSASSVQSYDMNNNFFASTQQDQNQNNSDTPVSNSTQDASGAAGNTFMGASTPGWKWTVMDGRQ